MRIKRISAVILLSCIFISTVFGEVCAQYQNVVASPLIIEKDGVMITIHDVPSDTWSPIGEGVKLGWVEGRKTEGNSIWFEPEANLTRGELAKLICTVLGVPVYNGTSMNSYVDIDPTMWQYQYVEATKDFFNAYGIGSSHTFRAAEMVTREETFIVSALAREFTALPLAEANQVLGKFSDVDEIHGEFKGFVAALVQADLIKGYNEEGNRLLRPRKNLTRAETVQILKQLLTFVPLSFKNLKVNPSNPLDRESYTLSGEVNNPNARVWVNYINESNIGTEATVDSFGKWQSGYMTQDFSSSSITIKIRAYVNGQEKIQDFTFPVMTDTNDPSLLIGSYPSSTSDSMVTLSGTVKSQFSSGLSLTINGRPVSFSNDGKFAYPLNLAISGANTFEVKAINKNGKENVQTITINRIARTIEFDFLDTDGKTYQDTDSTTYSSVIFQFFVKGADGVTSTDASISGGVNGLYTCTVKLDADASKTINFIATNSDGIKESKTITLHRKSHKTAIALPTFNFLCLGSVRFDKDDEIRQTVQEDSYLFNVMLSNVTILNLNGKEQSGYQSGEFKHAVTLDKGDNVFVFEGINVDRETLESKKTTVRVILTYSPVEIPFEDSESSVPVDILEPGVIIEYEN